jgi:hypothetical protein
LDFFSAKDEDTNWIIPVVVNISNELRLVAGLVSIISYRSPVIFRQLAFYGVFSEEKSVLCLLTPSSLPQLIVRLMRAKEMLTTNF